MLLRSNAPVAGRPLEWTEIADPEPGEGEARVRVRACAICRTDLHVIEGDLPARKLPLVPGHQAVGVVERLGRGCTRLAVGERVGIAWLRGTCGECVFCRSGAENLCEGSRYTGWDADGGYAVAHDFGLDDLPFRQLALGDLTFGALRISNAPAAMVHAHGFGHAHADGPELRGSVREHDRLGSRRPLQIEDQQPLAAG